MADYILNHEVVDDTEEKFSRDLINRDFIYKLIDKSADNKALFDDLLFTSKYLMGLFKALAFEEKNAGEEINIETAENLQKFEDILKTILGAEYKEYESIYSKHQTESFQNLVTLIAELELLKLHINDIKRES